MKKLLILYTIALILSSCGATIHTIVDANISQPYQNPLIVIPYQQSRTYNFTNTLKERIEFTFNTHDEKAEVLHLKQANETLTLNANDSFEDKINYAIIHDDKDLLILFKPKNLHFVDGILRTVIYEIVGIDTQTNKEVWKANLNSSSSVGPSLFANKCAQLIYSKLKYDGIL